MKIYVTLILGWQISFSEWTSIVFSLYVPNCNCWGTVSGNDKNFEETICSVSDLHLVMLTCTKKRYWPSYIPPYNFLTWIRHMISLNFSFCCIYFFFIYDSWTWSVKEEQVWDSCFCTCTGIWILWWMPEKIWKCKCLAVLHGCVRLSNSFSNNWWNCKIFLYFLLAFIGICVLMACI